MSHEWEGPADFSARDKACFGTGDERRGRDEERSEEGF